MSKADTPSRHADENNGTEHVRRLSVPDRLYARFGWKVWPIAAAAAWVPAVPLLYGIWLQFSRLLLLPTSTFVTLLAFQTLWYFIGVPLLVVDTVRASGPLRRAPTGQSDLLAQWQTIVHLPRRMTRTCLILAFGVGVPGSFVMAAILRADARTFVFMWICASMTLPVVIAGIMFATPILVRPFVADLMTRLEQPPPSHTMTLRTRLAFLIPVFSVATTTTGAVIGLPKGGGIGAVTILTIAFSAVFGLLIWTPLVFLFARSMQSQLSDLLAATERIENGNYRQPVPDYWVDELGSLAASLNKAMRGLSERRQMADEVRESRARIVAAADASRKKIERNIHDGAQQQLVALTLDIRMLQSLAPTMSCDEVVRTLDQLAEAVKGTLAELRDLAHGLHPAVLTTDGLGPALQQLANRARVPVTVDVPPTRFDDQIETTAYFVVAEALANIAKYAHANNAAVVVSERHEMIRIEITDDGIGGARPHPGSGLVGLADRVAAIGGVLVVDSPIGRGTRITADLPLAGSLITT
ncbi:histidine kinase [Smaragdicoccus niigatensis]|uniref:sensor histidine kinase n=1 Tax=Smaragdicoccus niigatensis TaxID=359359 RepID=UPI00037DEB70|nr:histidine kinase [Smaragdicoccus niigatensis]